MVCVAVICLQPWQGKCVVLSRHWQYAFFHVRSLADSPDSLMPNKAKEPMSEAHQLQKVSGHHVQGLTTLIQRSCCMSAIPSQTISGAGLRSCGGHLYPRRLPWQGARMVQSWHWQNSIVSVLWGVSASPGCPISRLVAKPGSRHIF